MAVDFRELVAAQIASIHPYQPGKPAEYLANAGIQGEIIKLASNENPFGPSPKVNEALSSALADLAIYPDANGFVLKAAISRHFGVAADQITLGNGSNDLLELIARTFLHPGLEVVFSQYAFLVYPLLAQSTGATARVVPEIDWMVDLDAMADAITSRCRMVFLANPNNPTGSMVAGEPLIAFLNKVPESTIVVLDEAYTEYVDRTDFVDGLSLLEKYPNLVVTRSFSKAWGLAGLRVGFAAASVQITDLMNRIRQPFNVNRLALVAATAALSDSQYVSEVVSKTLEGRAFLESELTRLGISFIPSVANFLTIEAGDAPYWCAQLEQQGVIVRPLANYSMPNHLRVTVGTMQQNQRFIAALERVIN